MKRIPVKALLKELRRRNIRFGNLVNEKEEMEDIVKTNLGVVAHNFERFTKHDDDLLLLDKISLYQTRHTDLVEDYTLNGLLRKMIKDVYRHNQATVNMLKRHVEKWK